MAWCWARECLQSCPPTSACRHSDNGPPAVGSSLPSCAMYVARELSFRLPHVVPDHHRPLLLSNRIPFVAHWSFFVSASFLLFFFHSFFFFLFFFSFYLIFF